MGETFLLIAAQVLAWAVLLCAVLAGVVIVERVFVLGRSRIPTSQLAVRLRTVLRRGEPAELESFCGQKRSPVMNTLRRFAVKWRTAQYGRVGLYDRAVGEELAAMERWLPMLATLAGIAPMLGVLSLISIYSDLLSGGPAQPLPFSGPLPPYTIAAIALLTGVVGLIMYNVFVVRVRSHTRDLEQLGWDLLPHLDSLAGTSVQGTAVRPEVPVFDDDEYFRKKV